MKNKGYYAAFGFHTRADVLGSAKQVHVDICADALQYGVGFVFYLKKGQDAFPAGEQKKKDAQCKKGHIAFQ